MCRPSENQWLRPQGSWEKSDEKNVKYKAGDCNRHIVKHGRSTAETTENLGYFLGTSGKRQHVKRLSGIPSGFHLGKTPFFPSQGD